MMTLANYGLGSGRHKDSNNAKLLSKSLQIRNRAELLMKQCLKSQLKITSEKRTGVLNLVRDYYSRIPFNVLIWNKYQVKQCVTDSILLLDTEFDPYKAHEAFVTLERMLINLISLPWHREFKKIFTYSGKFRLSVSEPLIGTEEVLKAAGFEQQRFYPSHLVLPDDRMPQIDDSESVTGVLFDCYLAQVVFADIIDVFENYCKPSKRMIEARRNSINCYSWIQAYFKQRSHQTTEVACSNIRELLNNLTNHLVNVEAITSTKLGSKTSINSVEPNPPNRYDSAGERSKANSEAHPSVRLTPQEKMKKFLAQQAQEDDNTLRLPGDLLRLPNNVETGRRLAQSSISRSISRESANLSDQKETSGHQPMANHGYTKRYNVQHKR